MQVANIPTDETLRMMTLKSLGILDSAKEDRFDRLTRLAKRMFDVPVAMVALIDENRQWMKSCAGMESMDIPRDISFCGHAILGDAVFVIPNMLLDERFIDNPLVVEQNVRFYAGAPIKASNGCKLGTLCLVDTKPREFSVLDCESLADLAAMVELEIAAIELAIHDELTGLLNRRGFSLLATNAMNFSLRKNLPMCMAFFDLNKFKQINDQFGHHEGDRALNDFARLLKHSSRDSDVLARQGGDEFIVYFMDATIAQAQLIIEKISNKIKIFNRESSKKYKLSFSHGLVVFDPDQHKVIKDLIDEADANMYKYKHAVAL